jgi:hypothetical protein
VAKAGLTKGRSSFEGPVVGQFEKVSFN